MFKVQFFSQASLIIGIPVIAILLYYSKKNRNNIFLAFSLANIWYALLLNILNDNLLILEYPAMMRTGNISVFLFFPFLFFYTRGAFFPGVFFKKTDIFYFLPLLIYLIDMSPFFFSDPNYKISIYRPRLNDPSFALKISEGWINFVGFELLLRYFSGLFFWILQIQIIWKYWKNHFVQKRPENKIVLWHILFLTFTYGTLIFPGIFGVILKLSWYNLDFLGLNLSLSLTVTAFFLLFSPEVLYGFLPFSVLSIVESKKPPSEIKETVSLLKKVQKDELEEKKINDLIEKIEKFVLENKVYLDPKYSIQSLSADLDVPVYQLSPLINNYFEETYNAWINRYRVQHFISLCNEPLKKELTLEALAKESGFSNRTTFINSFKKVTGFTPSSYLKKG